MSSRVEPKATARAARLAAEADARRRAGRQRALIRLGALAGIALIVVAAAVLVSSRADTPAAARPAEAAALFDGLPQDGISLGSADAPVTLVEFADLQCPYCAVYARDVLPTVVDRYVRTGRVRLELHLRTFLGEDSHRGAVLAAAAGRQDRLWPFVDAFYRNQGTENSGYATDAFLRGIAGATDGLDVQRALADRDRPATQRTLAEAEQLASKLGSESTPAFYLRRGHGPLAQVEPADLTPDAFTAGLDDALAAR
jgi:protein-disulfide isomerase